MIECGVLHSEKQDKLILIAGTCMNKNMWRVKNLKKFLIYAIITLCLSTVLMNIYSFYCISDNLIVLQEHIMDAPDAQDIRMINDYPLTIYLKDIQVYVSIYKTLTTYMFVLCAVLLLLYLILSKHEILKEY